MSNLETELLTHSVTDEQAEGKRKHQFSFIRKTDQQKQGWVCFDFAGFDFAGFAITVLPGYYDTVGWAQAKVSH